MACAGSSGGAQPPHQHPFRLPGQCEDDYLAGDVDDTVQPHPQKKRRGQRGPATGTRVLKARRKNGGLKLPLIWDPRHGTNSPVGDYAAIYKSEVGRITRVRCPPGMAWESIDARVKDQIVYEIERNFDNVRREIVLSDAQTLFRKGKSKMKDKASEFVAKNNTLPPPKPPKPDNVETDQMWNDFLHKIQTADFTKRSKQNSINRGKHKYTTKQGRMSLAGHRMKGCNPSENSEGLDPIIIWGDKHKNKDGSWDNETARHQFEEMMKLRLEIAPEGCRLTAEQEKDIFRRVLGVRRDYLIGLGPSQPSTSMPSQNQSQLSTEALLKSRDKSIANLKRKVKEQNKQWKDAFAAVIGSLAAAQIPNLTIPNISLPNEDEDEDADEDGDGDGDGDEDEDEYDVGLDD